MNKKLDPAKLPEGCVSLIRLMSGGIKNFVICREEGDKYLVGFEMKPGANVMVDKEENQMLFEIEAKGLESLIGFLNLFLGGDNEPRSH